MRHAAILLGLLAFAAPARADENVPDLRTRKSGSDWPKFLGPNGDSSSDEKGILTKWPKEGPKVLWQADVGEGYGMPVTSLGRLFLFDRVEDTARLRCLNSETGAQLWKFEYPTKYVDKYNYSGGPRCCPIVDGDRVYIYGAEGMLHCLRVTDGEKLWEIDTLKQFNVVQNFFGVGSTPVIEGDLLIAQVGGSPAGSDDTDFMKLKGNGTGVVAFDKRTGKVVYKISDELASYAGPVLSTIGGRRWCFVFARAGLLGFDPVKGRIDFHFPWRADILESVNAANPVVVGDKVLISETYGPGAAALQVKPGGYKELWSDADKAPTRKSLRAHWCTPVYHDGYVYGCSGRHEYTADLRCIELETGKEMWVNRFPEQVGRVSLLKVDGHLICLGEYGLVFLTRLNPEKFEPVSISVPTDPKTEQPLLSPPCWAAPILSHGLLYVRGSNRLLCMELIPEKKE